MPSVQKRCPYCKGPLDTPELLYVLGAKQTLIYHMVMKAGADGIDNDELMRECGIARPTTLRTHVFYLNRKLRGARMAIKGYAGKYRLEEF